MANKTISCGVIITDGSSVLIARPTGETRYNIPKGMVDPGESFLQTAVRELEEETGYTAKKWSYIRRIHPVISYSTELIDIYLAEDLVPGKSCLDAEEFLDVFAAPLEQLLGWVESGEITDVKTTISAYWLDRYRRGLVQAQSLS